MRFQPTIDLWIDNGINQNRIISGELKLQTGQWVRCGSDKLSRFVGVTSNGTIWCVHPTGHRTNPIIKIDDLRKSSQAFKKSN